MATISENIDDKPTESEEERNKRLHSEVSNASSDQSPPTKESKRTEAQLETLVQNLVDSRYRALLRRVNQLEDTQEQIDRQVDFLTDQNIQLWDRLDDQEQYTRGTSIRIYGIPETVSVNAFEEENTDKLVVENLNKELGMNLYEEQIGISHRIGRSNGQYPRAILCQFKGKKTKKAAINAIKSKAKANRGRRLPLNIVEDLTSPRAALATKARRAQADKKILGTWTTNGKIKARLNNKNVVELKTVEDLEKYTRVQANSSTNENHMETESIYHHQPISLNETTLPATAAAHLVALPGKVAMSGDPSPSRTDPQSDRPQTALVTVTPNSPTQGVDGTKGKSTSNPGEKAVTFADKARSAPLSSNAQQTVLKPAVLNVPTVTTVNFPLTRQSTVPRQQLPSTPQMLTPRASQSYSGPPANPHQQFFRTSTPVHPTRSPLQHHQGPPPPPYRPEQTGFNLNYGQPDYSPYPPNQSFGNNFRHPTQFPGHDPNWRY